MSDNNIERELDKVMASEIQNRPNVLLDKLKIDEDTSFNIYYDIYNDGNTDYFYIKMVESTAVAPFYYNRSFTIEELQELDDIFRSCDLSDVKEHIKNLFKEEKIKLIYDNNKEIIKMEINVVLFVTNYNVYFRLYKEMIPEEKKDEQLLNLYEIEKSKIKMIKDLASLFDSFSNQDEKAIGEKLKQLIFKFEIPGIEKGQLNFGGKSENHILKIKENHDKKEISVKEDKINGDENKMNIEQKEENENDIISLQSKDIFESRISKIPNQTNYKIFTNVRKPDKRYHLNEGKNTIDLIVKNITDEDWPMNDIKLVCNEETSTIKCTVENCMYEIGKGQDGDFKVIFDPKDLIPGKKFQCNLELFLRREKIEDGYVELFISVPKKKK